MSIINLIVGFANFALDAIGVRTKRPKLQSEKSNRVLIPLDETTVREAKKPPNASSRNTHTQPIGIERKQARAKTVQCTIRAFQR